MEMTTEPNDIDAGRTVLLDRPAPHIALVTLNRPAARNAVNAEVAEQLSAIVASLDADPEVRAVVITGAGDRAFCTGADLKIVAAGGLDDLFLPHGGFAGFVRTSRRKPWIAAINGDALAGGLEIALACDILLAVYTARFGLPEVTRGLAASAGGLFRLPRAIPRTVALEMIATGRLMPAHEALALHLVTRLTSSATLLDEALDLATQIAGNAPLAVQESLAVARAAYDASEFELDRLGQAAQQRLMGTADFYEGAQAFVDKRSPKWLGR
ncbi:MAG: Enoyl-CoA hydratase/isomerase [Bradyrhizobium sp.]|nr:Enoyl-CoA hydratase/isomerase [Bradyrhizobium sp.]